MGGGSAVSTVSACPVTLDVPSAKTITSVLEKVMRFSPASKVTPFSPKASARSGGPCRASGTGPIR